MVRPVQANLDGAIGGLERCCRDICTRMKTNFSKVNDGKTKVLLLGAQRLLSTISMPDVSVGESLILSCYNSLGLGDSL